MTCHCPSTDKACANTCAAIWWAKQVIKRGGLGGYSIVADTFEEALGLLDQLEEAMGDENIDFDLITTTAEKLYAVNQPDAAFSLSQTLISEITMANFYNYIPVEQTKTILQRNYKIQAEIFASRGGKAEDNFAQIALESLDPKSAS